MTRATATQANKRLFLWISLAAVAVLVIGGSLFYFNRPHTSADKDDFAADKALDPGRWQANTSLLTTLAEAQDSRYVDPLLTFDHLGMRMAGVNGTFEFTGVQSTHSFAPPFSVRVRVMGAISHGNTFGLYIIGNDLRQFLKIEGNLNPQSGYQGLSIGSHNVLRNVGTDQWYTMVVAVDVRGLATVTVADSNGTTLATRAGLQMGLGPFFVVLGQREGAPLAVGPNEAVWSFTEVTSSSNPFASSSNESNVSDANIVRNVKAMLFDDSSLRRCTIDVTAQNGIVTLIGVVNTESEKSNAVRIANQQQGVRQVVDQLLLSGGKSASQGTVASRPNAGNSASGNSAESSSASSNPVSSLPARAVTSEAQCTGPGDPDVPNGTRGTIHILSGTGVFSNVSSSNKRVAVATGGEIDGTLNIQALNHGPDFAVAPLIWTPSWGDLSVSWRVVSPWIHPGQTLLSPQIKEFAPQTPGIYYIVLAFYMETNGASVASATNWARGQPVWGDGNDIGQSNSGEIEQAQRYGCTIHDWLSESGHQLIYLPADAITVDVGTATAAVVSNTSPKQSTKGDIRTVDFRNFRYPSDCSAKMDAGFPNVIPAANGQWGRRMEGGTTIGFDIAKIVHGTLKDGAVQTVVATSCHGVANFDYEEIFVFDTSAGAAKLLAKLTPSDWGNGQDCSGAYCPILELGIVNRQLAISFGVGGSHACPATLVTAKFQWNGSRFFQVGQDGKPYVCGR